VRLAEALSSGQRPKGIFLNDVRRILVFPCCFPHKPADRATIASWGFTTTPIQRVGETLLVSHQSGSSIGELWWLAFGTEPVQPIAFRGGLQREWLRASALASKAQSLVMRPDILDAGGAWSIVPVKMGLGSCSRSESVSGASFELPMALAAASLLADVPLESDIAATGRVSDDGKLESVDGLRAKIAAIADHAPAVRRVFVASHDEPKAKAFAAASSRSGELQVHGFDDLREAICAALPEERVRQYHLQAWRANPKSRETAAQRFFLTILRTQTRVVCWDAIAATAQLVADESASHEDAWHRATCASTVAQRHAAGSVKLTLDKSWLGRLPVVHRLALSAQEVQSCTDSGDDPRGKTKQALALVPESDLELLPEHLMLLGACGRAFGAVREYDDAKPELVRACRGWETLARPSDAGRPFCELVRVLALQRKGVELSHWIEWATSAGLVDDPCNRSYAITAIASALLLMGRPDEANRRLEESKDWFGAAKDLYRHRQRLQARIWDALGDAAKADQARASLAHAGDGDIQWLLARLDVALSRSGDVDGTVQSILGEAPARLEKWGADVLRLHALLCQADMHGRALGEALAREYRY
jgi:hypothetical protein